jgi:hypothetical protein
LQSLHCNLFYKEQYNNTGKVVLLAWGRIGGFYCFCCWHIHNVRAVSFCVHACTCVQEHRTVHSLPFQIWKLCLFFRGLLAFVIHFKIQWIFVENHVTSY